MLRTLLLLLLRALLDDISSFQTFFWCSPPFSFFLDVAFALGMFWFDASLSLYPFCRVVSRVS